MNSLVLLPGRTGLAYARVQVGSMDTPATEAHRPGGFHGVGSSVGEIQAVLSADHDRSYLDVLAIRAVYGGLDFPAPIIVDEKNQSRLHKLGGQAPLAVANLSALIDEARASFPATPIALAFETSFFVSLPARETTFALPEAIASSVRRWGYHGLYHDVATAELEQALRKRPARMLSICLDPRPEIAAVLGRAPLMVTSGSTPVEGLPGELNCGEIDPAIALALAADPSFGPERANLLLTRESGFCGMLGWPATLGEVLSDGRARVTRVREHLLYHMALAAGSGLAALEGLDGVVFSGRYAEHGGKVAAYLLPKLERTLDLPAGSLPWRIVKTPLSTIVAEAGVLALLAKQSRSQAHGRRDIV